MAFKDGLTEICTISSVSITSDDYGKESKGFTPLYSNIKCRLGKGVNRLVQGIDKEEKFVTTYKLYTETENGGAAKGSKVELNGVAYIIFGGQPATGGNGDHYIYNITVDEQS